MTITQAFKRKKRLIVHVKNVVQCLCRDLNIDPSTKSVILSRLHHEGLPFLTKTLPSFSKYAISCVDAGYIIDARTYGITAFRIERGAPHFMRGYLVESINGSADALYCIRQLCEYFYKTAFSFTTHDLDIATRKYLDVDTEVGKTDLDWGFIEQCRKTFERKFPELTRYSIDSVLTEHRPRFGPGAFVGSEALSEGFEIWKKIPNSKQGLFSKAFNGISGYFKGYPSSAERLITVSDRHEIDRDCHIRFVPKDSRGPRTISKEQRDVIRVQMSFNDFMSRYYERFSHRRMLFSDQTVHRSLAHEASITRENATLDLKDASDRVSLKVVRHITQNSPIYRWFNKYARATHAVLPNGDRVRINKYANMGSGLCFPTLAMVIWISIVTKLELRFPGSNPGAKVFVYGDDVIVPSAWYGLAIDALTRVGLLVNSDKSFVLGFFRESCGGDYYHGKEVSPIRFRLSGETFKETSEYRNGCLPIVSDNGILQLERHCRQLSENTLSSLASYYYKLLVKRLGPLPDIHGSSSVLGVYDPHRSLSVKGYTCFDPVKAYVPTTRKKESRSVCPYKGIGASLISLDGLGEDWRLTPLRRQVTLKRRVVDVAEIQCYGTDLENVGLG